MNRLVFDGSEHPMSIKSSLPFVCLVEGRVHHILKFFTHSSSCSLLLFFGFCFPIFIIFPTPYFQNGDNVFL